MLNRLLDWVCPCRAVRSTDTGTWSSAATPILTCPTTPARLELPQDANCVGRAARATSTTLSKLVYRYQQVPELDAPWGKELSGVASLPRVWSVGQLLTQSRAFENHREARQALGDSGQFRDFEELRKLFQRFPVPTVADDWRDDRIYADQLVAGFDPITLRRVTIGEGDVGLPWPVLVAKLDHAAITALTAAVGPLEPAIANGRVFAADYAAIELAGPTLGARGARSGLVPLAPIVLLARSDPSTSLRPVSIQLGQTPGSSVFVADGSPGWLAARLWAQGASYTLAQLIYHLTWHHVIAEAFALVTLRSLPQCHPLHALLVHHVAGTLSVNVGTVDQFFDDSTQRFMMVGREAGYRLINAHYVRWTFDDWDFPASLARRGVDDPQRLPYYPQRDDGMLYWELVGDYVRDYLAVFYGDPEDLSTHARIAADFELQAWADELSAEAAGPANVAGFPPRFADFAELHRALQRLIFMVGPHHASLNFAQLAWSTFTPNMPALMQLRPPSPSEPVDERFLLDTLPGVDVANAQTRMSLQAAYWFGSFLDYERFFCGGGKNAAARDVVARFNRRLDAINDTIVARNHQRIAHGNLPYTLMLPSNVPNDVSA
jgi:hypothetical protein